MLSKFSTIKLYLWASVCYLDRILAGLSLILQFSCLSFPRAEISGMHHHAPCSLPFPKWRRATHSLQHGISQFSGPGAICHPGATLLPWLTCFRNFIHVQVMGWVPVTFPNSSTGSPARTFWSSGNWMIWGGIARREQVESEEGALDTLISLEPLAMLVYCCLSSLLECSRQAWRYWALFPEIWVVGPC